MNMAISGNHIQDIVFRLIAASYLTKFIDYKKQQIELISTFQEIYQLTSIT